MDNVSLDDLVRGAQTYENTPVAVPDSLRRTGWMSIVSVLMGSIVYPILPPVDVISGSRALLVLEGWLAEIVGLVLRHFPEIMRGNQAALLFAGLVLLLTDRFRRGRVAVQVLILPIVFIGAANSFVLGLIASITAVNLLIWVLVVGLGLTVGVLVFYVVKEIVI